MSVNIEQDEINLREVVAKAYKPKYAEIPIRKWFDNALDITDFTDDSISSSTCTESGGTVTGTYVDGNVKYRHNGISTIIGKIYNLSITMTVEGDAGMYVGTTYGGSEVINAPAELDAVDTFTWAFRAESTTTYVSVTDSASFTFNTLVVREAYELPANIKVQSVFEDGALLREGSAEDYTIDSDGLIKTITFAVEPNLNTAEVAVDYWREI